VIYDELGKEVITLIDQSESAGKHMIQWNTKNIPSGIYYYRLRAGSFMAVKRMQVIK
jgi:flagellar hook assembly protein FlgD